jgi:anaerobic selenocysteine-containing dehydrogenase
MGVINRWGLDRLRHAFRYSRQHTTICVTPAESGWRAGVGKLNGVDPREIALSDLVVMWGGNPVSTQVNLMHHVTRARKERGAVFAVVDVYRTPTVEAADIALIVRPGTDAALALGMMHVLFAEGYADRDYLARLTDFTPEVEAHIKEWTPERAAAVTGLAAADIVDFARLYGRTRNSFLRVGFGFTRSRNGAASMHAVSCLPAVTGAWQYEGGGAFFINYADNWGLDVSLAHGLDQRDLTTRILDQSRIGPVLCGEPAALAGGPPVTAMIMQNANSAVVAPDSRAVRQGLCREDLFLCVHEQFLTATAAYADIVLPAAMFLETDDLYYGLGHTFLTVGSKVLDRFAQARSNHEVVNAIAQRLGSNHPSFFMTDRELVDATLRASGHGTVEEAAERGWIDFTQPFREAHFLDRFPTADGRFHFRPDWAAIGGLGAAMPRRPDHLETYETSTEALPFRLVSPPARSFLNSTFTETTGSRSREGKPRALIHTADAARLGIAEETPVRLGNARGEVTLTAHPVDTAQPGVIIVEGVWPNADYAGGIGINQLTGADPVPPNGGTAFHDVAVWLRPVTA